MSEVWEKRRLGDILTLEYGKPLPSERRKDSGGIPAFGANGIRCWTDDVYFDRPSIIVGRKGSAGAVTLADGPFWPLDVTYFVRYDETESDLKFLFYLLKSLDLSSLAKGVKPGLNRNDVYELEVALPSKAEQERVATIVERSLRALDVAKVNCKKNLALVADLKQSMFGEILASFDDGSWELSSVAEIAKPGKGTIRSGPFGSQLLHSEFVDSGVAVLGIDNAVDNQFSWKERRFITEEKFKELSRFEAFPGDVVITIMGTCGRSAVLPPDLPKSITSKHLACITLDSDVCRSDYLNLYFLYHPDARSYLEAEAGGAVMDGLNLGIIRAMPIRLPPVDLQKTIERKWMIAAQQIDRVHATTVARLRQISLLEDSVLSSALVGELATNSRHSPGALSPIPSP